MSDDAKTTRPPEWLLTFGVQVDDWNTDINHVFNAPTVEDAQSYGEKFAEADVAHWDGATVQYVRVEPHRPTPREQI